MRLSRLMIALCCLLAPSLHASAVSNSADGPHVHVQLLIPVSGFNRGATADAGFYFKLEPGWHIYWKNAGDAGEPPHIQWTLPEGIAAGAIQFPVPSRLPLGPLMDFGYENEVLFPLTLNVAKTAKPGPATLHAKVDWLVCRATCIPGKAELEVSRDVYDHPRKPVLIGADADVFNRFVGQLPKPLPTTDKAVFQPTNEGFRLFVETGQTETEASFFPSDESILDNPAPQKLASTAKGLILDLKKDANLSANPAQLNGVLELSGGRAYELAARPGKVTAQPLASAASHPAAAAATASSAPETAPTSSPGTTSGAKSLLLSELVRISGLAFLGGLILNLMPCVFPVLFLKGLALVNSGNEAGVPTDRSSSVGWEQRHKLRAHGIVYTAGILVSFWVLVAVLLGLRAAGATLGWGFQFQSPIFLELMAGLLFFMGLSLAGQFEIGLTLTSAGGSLLVDKQGAAKQGYTGSFFTGVLAVIVATPCTAPFMGAAIGYALAQPAAVTFAVFTALALGLAAPYVALTLQPAWTRLLPRPGAWMEILRQAISVPIFITVIWLAWVLAQAYGAAILAALLASFLFLAIAGWFLGRWPAARWSTVVAALILLCVIAIDAWAPRGLIEPVFNPRDVLTVSINGGWQPWSEAAVSRSLAAGQPVFVDFTASWCLSCQVNERVALDQPAVEQAFQARNVLLMRADWTRHDESITQALTALGRSGVPAYALYTPGRSEPELLPEVLTPGIVTDALNKLPKPAH
jgi:thiol:disulfide interchange protein DsbD